MKKLFLPLSWLYSFLARTHGYLYRKQILKTVRLPVPVISVGNLTVGGTGKTPIVDFLIQYLTEKKFRVGVVYRAYKAEAKHPVLIHLDSGMGPNFFGDEAYLIKNKHPEAVVCSGADKASVALHLVQNENVDVILVDDGYQHHKLERDYNILIVDATEPIENYAVLPVGRGRESFQGINRADVIFLTKSNLTSFEHLQKVISFLPKEKKQVHFGYRWKNQELFSGLTGKALLVTGVAKPETVENLIKNHLPSLEFETLVFADHYEYRSKDIARILDYKELKSCQYVITTDKDRIKLDELWPVNQALFTIELELSVNGASQEFFVDLEKVISKS